jgi:TonB family protein
MIAGVNKPGVEVSMPHPRSATHKAFVFLALVVFLVSGNVKASPSPSPQQGHLVPPNLSQQYPMTVEVLNSLPEGVDFERYVNNLYSSVRRNFLAKLPESSAGEETGIVVVRVHIQVNGSLPEKSLRLVSSSGKKGMDDAVLSAIRTAAPFVHLPGASKLDLLFTFYIKSIPPPQKPKIVPVGIAANHIRESITTERP